MLFPLDNLVYCVQSSFMHAYNIWWTLNMLIFMWNYSKFCFMYLIVKYFMFHLVQFIHQHEDILGIFYILTSPLLHVYLSALFIISCDTLGDVYLNYLCYLVLLLVVMKSGMLSTIVILPVVGLLFCIYIICYYGCRSLLLQSVRIALYRVVFLISQMFVIQDYMVGCFMSHFRCVLLHIFYACFK